LGLFRHECLIKRYVGEPGRAEVLRVLRRHEWRCIVRAAGELRSALRRRVSERTLDEERATEIVKRLTIDRAYWTSVEVSSEVLTAAETLVAAHPLRALDAIHVASAQLFVRRMAAVELIFVSADARQTSAATAIGMTTRLIES
jgi:predicted nucleic acid-binding protein